MPTVRARIEVPPGRGYVLLLNEEPGTGFPKSFSVVIDELNFYDGNDDILLAVTSQQVEGLIQPLGPVGEFEVSFSGEVEFALADEHRGVFEQRNNEAGVDYTLYLSSTDGTELWSGDDWEFVENRNMKVGLLRTG